MVVAWDMKDLLYHELLKLLLGGDYLSPKFKQLVQRHNLQDKKAREFYCIMISKIIVG